ncbi:helix-turn-helix domain-containing protein [Verrucomicrobiota bacterium]
MASWYLLGHQTEPLTRFPPHRTPHWELLLYTGGRGVSKVGRTFVPFTIGTVVCVPPNKRHEEIAEEPYTCIVFHIRDLNRLPDRPCVYQDSKQQFRALAEVVLQEHAEREPNWERVVADMCRAMEALLDRWEHQINTHPETLKLRANIMMGFREPGFTITAAEQGCGLSKDHLRRSFVKENGMTPMRFLMEIRMEEARRLLRHSPMRIAEVGETVGIRNPYYFSRVFKNKMGISPRAYRKSDSD